MHLRVYKDNPGQKAFVHGHPQVFTTFSIVDVKGDSSHQILPLLLLLSFYTG